MPNIINRTGNNLSLLGYSAKREYFGGTAIPFRQVETYNYEYITLDLVNLGTGLSARIAADISGQFSAFSGDVTIRGLDVPSAYEVPQDQIRTAKYDIVVEVRKPIFTGTSSGYYSGLNYLTSGSGVTAINNFTENFSFENNEDSQRFNHSINFELRTGDKNYAQYLASGLLSSSEPGSLGLSILSGYLGIYSDANSQNYYTESYDSFKNSYSFQKTKNLYKISGSNFTYQLDTKYEYNDGIVNVNDEIKVRGKANFTQAKDGLETLIGSSYSRSSNIYDSYKNLAPFSSTGSLFSTPLKTIKKYNVQSLMAECSLSYTDNPLYKSIYKQDQLMVLNKDSNGICKVSNQYNFTLLKNIQSDMDAVYFQQILGATNASDFEALNFYKANDYSNRSLSLVSISAKTPRRKRAFSFEYEYSDDPRYNVSLQNISGNLVAFKNVDVQYSDNEPKDSITEYKVINKSQTLINYAYQQNPGTKTVTINAVRYRPNDNQLTNFSLPSSEIAAMYCKALNILTSSFVNLNGLNYYLNNINFRINSENRLELTASINYTKKKYG